MSDRGEFRNEPFTDFSRPENAEAMRAALRLVRGRFGKRYDLLLDGQWVATEKTTRSLNPSNPDEVVGEIAKAS